MELALNRETCNKWLVVVLECNSNVQWTKIHVFARDIGLPQPDGICVVTHIIGFGKNMTAKCPPVSLEDLFRIGITSCLEPRFAVAVSPEKWPI